MAAMLRNLGVIAGLVALAASGAALAVDAPGQVVSRVLQAIDDARAQRGLPRLQQTPGLVAAAEQRARDIAALPPAQRMNRRPGIGAFLTQRGIRNYEQARERLFMIGGYEDRAGHLIDEWRRYDEAWNSAMDPEVTQVGAGFVTAGDGTDVFLAILVTPLPDIGGAQVRDMERVAFEGVNEQRLQHGLAALVWDDRLAAIARAHSADMAARHYFNHVSPDGKHPADRVRDAGLQYRSVAENIAENRGMKDPARAAVRGWMESPGHRANILDGALAMTGMGVAVDPEGNIFYTQLFYTPPAKAH